MSIGWNLDKTGMIKRGFNLKPLKTIRSLSIQKFDCLK